MSAKGEWTVNKLPDDIYPKGVTDYGLKWSIEADNKGICYFSDKWLSSPKGTEMQANARLIASAPDMYEALEGWSELWDMRPLDSGEDMQQILKRCWAKTVKALARAEGK